MLRAELHPWGIRVSIVIPGEVTTSIWEKGFRRLDDMARQLHSEAREMYRLDRAFTGVASHSKRSLPLSPEGVATAVEHALAASTPKSHYVLGLGARVSEFGRRIPLPDGALDWMAAQALRRSGYDAARGKVEDLT